MLRTVVGALLVAATATTVCAQDYVVTTGGVGQYLDTRPSGATLLNVTTASAGPATTAVNLPFEFPYYGRTESTAVVNANGMIVLGATGAIANANNPGASHGQFSGTQAFPFSPTGDVDGLVAPHWTILFAVNDGTAGCGYVYAWTAGTAPNRRFVISWENVSLQLSPLVTETIQCQLYEGTGRIVFSYSASWGNVASWICGLDAPVDSRFVVPAGIANAVNTNHNYSGADLVFDPRTVTYTGSLLYDKIVSDASGIGNSTTSNQPLAGLRVELRRDGGIVAGTTTTAADGSFSVAGIGVASTSTGTLVAVARNAACAVTGASGGNYPEWTAVSGLSFSSGGSVGSYDFSSAGDLTGAVRAALNVARVVGLVESWAQSRTSAAIPAIAVVYDVASSAATAYSPAGASSASLVVGSAASSNDDAWDDAVVAKTYGRHVLATIAATQTTPLDYRFDAVTDAQNAFAEGFGLYLWAVVSGTSTAIDGRSSNSATVYNLESPTITVTKGFNVAGCMAGALYDLLDPANETIDKVDGTSTPDRVFHVVDSLTVPPTSTNFLQAWVGAGYDAPGITRVFVGNGVLADDAYEPNDSQSEAASLGNIGFTRASLVLNRFNEDWYAVTLPAATNALLADAKYDSVSTGATVAVEIRDIGGGLLATGAFNGGTGAVHAITGPLPAGTYRVGVRHVSGNTVPAYTFQAYVAPSMAAAPIRDWTVGRAYDSPLGVTDGIAPYTLSTVSSSMPPGMLLNNGTLHGAGTPTQVGSFPVTIQLKDSGDPANIVSRTETIVIHDVFKLPIAPFVGFPAGKAVDVTLPIAGGTTPFLFSTSSGALPAGLVFDANSLHVTGMASPASSAFSLDGVDVAGSSDHLDTRGVVAVALTGKNVPADLAAGTDACGWWFDAVEGSTVSFSVATAKGRAKRTLTGMLLAPDRSAVTGGAIKPKSGALSATKLVCPLSGRYYFVASSTDGGQATQLLGTLALAPPKSGKGVIASFAPSDTTSFDVGALPGAVLTVKYAGDKKEALVVRVVSVLDPTGAAQSYGPFTKASGQGGVLTMTLPTGGTWTVTLGSANPNGNPGKLTYSFSIKQPKGATYSAD